MRIQRGTSSRVLRGLPIFWKLLLPFLTLILVLGALGAFLIVRDLSSRAQSTLDQELLVRSLGARSLVHDRELYLLESVNFAANLQGMAKAIQVKNTSEITSLLHSVLALKTELALVAATDKDGLGLAEFARLGAGTDLVETAGTRWSEYPFVIETLGSPSGAKTAGFLVVDGVKMLAIAAPVCSEVQECAQVGATIVGFPLDLLAAEAGGGAAQREDQSFGVTIFDAKGSTLSGAGSAPKIKIAQQGSPDQLIRRTERIGSSEVASLYAPLEIQESIQGTIAVSLPTARVFASVQGAGVRLSLILLAGMAGIVAIGAMLSRFLLAQVKPLMDTNRALGSGDLSARAPVLADDELGELARGVNQMADQLQASYETLEVRVSQRTEEVRRLLRERTEFFTGVSHEFRTPIAVILSQAEMMLDSKVPKKDPWARETGKAIIDSTNQLLFLINDILDLAKAEAGQIEMKIEDVSVREVFRVLRRTIEGLASAGGLELSVRVPRQLPNVEADRSRLREVILNLVDNAVKYTPKGGKLGIASSQQGELVEIAISDNGVGIPKEAKERIFEPFYRVPGTKAQRGQPSSGLGLALAKRLVEGQGGEIDFSSEPGVGTTFRFRLKVAHLSGSKRPRTRGTSSNGSQIGQNGKHTPMLVGGRFKA